MRLIVLSVIAALLSVACGSKTGEAGEASDVAAVAMDRTDSCDLRQITGTCVEYTMRELDNWYRENIARICPLNSRGELAGVYREGARCPAGNRVARCEDILEDSADRLQYDKHYYSGTAAGFSWEAENVRTTCESLSGRFVPE